MGLFQMNETSTVLIAMIMVGVFMALFAAFAHIPWLMLILLFCVRAYHPLKYQLHQVLDFQSFSLIYPSQNGRQGLSSLCHNHIVP